MKKIIYFMSLIVVLIVIWRQIGETQAASLPSSTELAQDDFRIIVQSVSSDNSPMQQMSFDIIVANADGVPVPSDKVQMQIKMPKMLCGIFPATIREIRQGTYEATVVPVMKGRWEAEASVRIGNEQYTVRHPFAVS
ncbi:FixH family protein [Cohnella endophytica]|nr:FixH family protein [Cohnella endophytica]